MSEWTTPINHDKDKDLGCPFCNKPLVIRSGKYGEFYGCSSFPACVYTCSVDKTEREDRLFDTYRDDYWWK